MQRLTAKRVNGIKEGYWTIAKKDELVQRLGRYEDTGLTPEEIQDMKSEKIFKEGFSRAGRVKRRRKEWRKHLSLRLF
mgnify:CR=1 FL=1